MAGPERIKLALRNFCESGSIIEGKTLIVVWCVKRSRRIPFVMSSEAEISGLYALLILQTITEVSPNAGGCLSDHSSVESSCYRRILSFGNAPCNSTTCSSLTPVLTR